MDLMHEDIRLVAPGLRPTVGVEAGAAAFHRAFALLPDLTAEIHRWSATGDVLFVEMTFRATVGGRDFRWGNVDRFRFEGGYAVERVAYFDAGRVRRAIVRAPSMWLPYLRLR